MSSPTDGRLYVGNLPDDIRQSELEDIFYKYGRINFVDLKNSKSPPFAFIQFDDPRDAEDAIRFRDGYVYRKCQIRVESPKNSTGGRGGGRGGGNFRGGDRGDRGGGYVRGRGGGGRGRGPPSQRTDYRVLVSGLPPSGSWQDLKDHMREAGDVCYADVYRDGTGVVEYQREKDMKYAVRKLDESKFRSHESEVSYIRVKEDNHDDGNTSRSRYSRSPVGRGRGSPTYSPVRTRDSRSLSRSRSPY